MISKIVLISIGFVSLSCFGQSSNIKTIIVNNYPPYTMVNEKGEPDGFSVDLARAVAQATGLSLSIEIG